MTKAPLIELHGVGRSFGGDADAPVRALADVSLTIGAGEFVCVTGPSGAGKSTLLHLLGCLERPTEGKYRVAGEDVAALDANALARLRGATFGFVFQGFNLLPGLSARDNAQLPARYAGTPRKAREARADELLAELGLAARAGHLAGELSGGEQQRAAIARALMNDPRVILADEPAGALDSAQGEAVMAALRELAERGRTIVVATHDRAAAAKAPRRIELRDGRVVADSGPPEEAPAASVPPPRDRGLGAWAALKLAVADGLRVLRSRSLATGLTLLGIAVGAWAVVTALGFASGAYGQSTDIIARLNVDEITVNGSLAVALTAEDLGALRDVVNVREVYPEYAKRVDVKRDAIAIPKVFVEGTAALRMPQGNEFNYHTLEHGRFLEPTDDAEGARVVVLNTDAQLALFPGGADPIDMPILIGGRPFAVKGVLATHTDLTRMRTVDLDTGEVTQPKERSLSPHLWVPFGTLLALFPDTSFVPDRPLPSGLSATVQVVDVDHLWNTAEAIRDLLIRRHGAAAEGAIVHPFNVRSAEVYRANLRNTLTVTGASAATLLLAAGFGVMAVMLASVGRRTAEIGLRVAVGAQRRDIAMQFLAEAALLTAVGSALGALVGFATATIAGRIAESPVAIEPWYAVVAAGFAIVVGLVFGVVPARRAARIDPVRALAKE